MEVPEEALLEVSRTQGGVELERLSDVIRLASCFQMPALVDFCANLFVATLTPANAIHRHNVALDHGLPQQVQEPVRLFLREHIHAIQVGPEHTHFFVVQAIALPTRRACAWLPIGEP
jgi:hypothetical protein